MLVHRSALIHGVTANDAIVAATQFVMILDIEDADSARELRLGFDGVGRLLEVVVLTLDDGRQFVIHAMKARKTYRALLRQQRSL
jgi:hypothetical protein